MKRMRNYLTRCLSGLAILLTSCAESDVLPLPDGSPLTIVTGIEGTSSNQVITRATEENDYDRGTFKADDRIRITRTRSGSTSVTVDYQFDGTSWTPVVSGNDILFESGTTYQAVYPLDYNGIRADQRSAENYRLSNRLETPASVKALNTGVLSFKEANQFKHTNVKLTLKFVGNVTLPGTSDFSVEGGGLYSGGSTQEHVYPFRPGGDGTHDWHVIIAPSSAATDIEVTLTTSNGVSYQCIVSCGRLAGKNYVYTLTVQNDVLVPVGETIKDWVNESVYNGSLT